MELVLLLHAHASKYRYYRDMYAARAPELGLPLPSDYKLPEMAYFCTALPIVAYNPQPENHPALYHPNKRYDADIA